MLGGWSLLTCSLTELLQSSSSSSSVWRRVAEAPAYWSTCAAVNGQLLAVGGCDEDFKATAAIHKYNPTTNSWDHISNMPTARKCCLVAVLPTSEMMVAGGQLSADVNTDKVEIASFSMIESKEDTNNCCIMYIYTYTYIAIRIATKQIATHILFFPLPPTFPPLSYCMPTCWGSYTGTYIQSHAYFVHTNYSVMHRLLLLSLSLSLSLSLPSLLSLAHTCSCSYNNTKGLILSFNIICKQHMHWCVSTYNFD